ncbi:hypothetical protein K4K56_005315 [Colletotrichum sp. SAR 10_98]|nr:hypothetical protein K4K56_005315 [Colletotrichum sp. SAR 10_98]
MGLELETERAIGNLGMVNYQLFLLNHDEEYLAVAIKQLEERVDICRRLRAPTDSQEDSRRKAAKAQTATAHEAIAFARLSLCYTMRGHLDKAIGAAWDCQKLAIQSGDPSKIAFSRLFYGRALLLDGQKEEALAQFNPSDGYTPVAALSKEPCEEYRGYIREMIDAGADLTLRDRSGYSALDFAVYSGDEQTQDILIEALQRQLGQDEVEQHRLESTLRKGYRELFQEILRPVLLEADKRSSVKRLRQAYARTLATDEEKAHQFDAFKYVRFSDFARHGKLPKSSESLTRRFGDDDDEDLYVIFMSYTWSKKKRVGGFSPDDMENTKYHQMMSALESFLLEHPNVDPKTVGIWLELGAPQKGERALDLGTGSAVIAAVLATSGAEVTAVDGSKLMLEKAEIRAKDAKLDMTFEVVDLLDTESLDDFSQRHPRFDLITCSMTLKELPDLEPLAAALPKLLAPGGRHIKVCKYLNVAPVKSEALRGQPYPLFLQAQKTQLSSVLKNSSTCTPGRSKVDRVYAKGIEEVRNNMDLTMSQVPVKKHILNDP